jgi:hypothetical protein
MFMPGEAALLGLTSPDSDAEKRRRALVLQSLAEAAAFRCRGELRTKATWRFWNLLDIFLGWYFHVFPTFVLNLFG